MTGRGGFAVVQEYWNAECSGDLDRVLSSFAPDAEFIFPGVVLHGRDHIRMYYEPVIEQNSELVVDSTNVIEQGEQVAVEYTCRIVSRDGISTEAHGCNVFTIRGGLIHRLRSYFIPDNG